jgi:hypothetical protein
MTPHSMQMSSLEALEGWAAFIIDSGILILDFLDMFMCIAGMQ